MISLLRLYPTSLRNEDGSVSRDPPPFGRYYAGKFALEHICRCLFLQDHTCKLKWSTPDSQPDWNI